MSAELSDNINSDFSRLLELTHLESEYKKIEELQDQGAFNEVERRAHCAGEEALKLFRKLTGNVEGKSINERQFDSQGSSPLSESKKNIDAVAKKGFFGIIGGWASNVSGIIRFGLNPDKYDAKGRTQLHKAIAANDIKTVNALIQSGANPNLREKRSGKTPLYIAYQSGNLEIVKVLLKAGANPITKEDRSIDTLLQTACASRNAGIVKELLRAGANPNALDTNNETPLQVACRKPIVSLQVVRSLIKYGANPNLKTGDVYFSPLFYASRYRREGVNLDIIRELIQEGADVDSKIVNALCWANSDIIEKIAEWAIQENFVWNRVQQSLVPFTAQMNEEELLNAFSIVFRTVEPDVNGNILKAYKNVPRMKEGLQQLFSILKGESVLGPENDEKLLETILALDMPIFDRMPIFEYYSRKHISMATKGEAKNKQRYPLTYLEDNDDALVDRLFLEENGDSKVGGSLPFHIHKSALILCFNKENVQQALENGTTIKFPRRFQTEQHLKALKNLLYRGNLQEDERYLSNDLIDLGERIGLKRPFINYLHIISAIQSEEEE